MAPRAIWKGAISFGMVVIPVKMYIATESKDFSFTTIHKDCASRLRMKRFCPTHDAEVAGDEIVRAYEYAKDQYVPIDDGDLEGLPLPTLHTIEITKFVERPSIDPVYFDRTYWLEPDQVGVKPYYLLKQALEKSNRVAVAKVAIRQKEHLCCIRPSGNMIAMETMYYPDEIRNSSELNLPEDKVKISEGELKMAGTLIDHLTGVFEPEEFHDEYRGALKNMIEAKLGGAEPVAAPEMPKAKVLDLMEALKASVEAAKKQKTMAPERELVTAGGRGAAAKDESTAKVVESKPKKARAKAK